jgi:hypothetical protein
MSDMNIWLTFGIGAAVFIADGLTDATSTSDGSEGLAIAVGPPGRSGLGNAIFGIYMSSYVVAVVMTPVSPFGDHGPGGGVSTPSTGLRWPRTVAAEVITKVAAGRTPVDDPGRDCIELFLRRIEWSGDHPLIEHAR